MNPDPIRQRRGVAPVEGCVEPAPADGSASRRDAARADRYTHLLVTRGQWPRARLGSHGLVPLLLEAKSAVSATELAGRVREAARQWAMTDLPHDATTMEQIKAFSGSYAVELLSDLWLSEVRLGTACSEIGAEEEAIEWVLMFDRQGRCLPDWQGPADGVIPKATPVTIRARRGSVSRLKIDLVF